MKPGDEFIKNCHTALKAVDMPSKEADMEEFLTGIPPPKQRDKEDDEMNPPKAKKNKRELKALSMRNLQVSLSLCLSAQYDQRVFYNDIQKHRKQFSDAWLTFLRLPVRYVFHNSDYLSNIVLLALSVPVQESAGVPPF